MTANTRQVGGKHYGLKEYQHWDVVHDFNLDYFQGQITKYVFRWREKGGIEDLRKARHYLDKYIELQLKEENPMQSITEALSAGTHVSNDRKSLHKGSKKECVICTPPIEAEMNEIYGGVMPDSGEPGPGYVDQDRRSADGT